LVVKGMRPAGGGRCTAALVPEYFPVPHLHYDLVDQPRDLLRVLVIELLRIVAGEEVDVVADCRGGDPFRRGLFVRGVDRRCE